MLERKSLYIYCRYPLIIIRGNCIYVLIFCINKIITRHLSSFCFIHLPTSELGMNTGKIFNPWVPTTPLKEISMTTWILNATFKEYLCLYFWYCFISWLNNFWAGCHFIGLCYLTFQEIYIFLFLRSNYETRNLAISFRFFLDYTLVSKSR